MHDTADDADLTGHASLEAQRKCLSSPSPLWAGALYGSGTSRLRQLDGRLMKAGGGLVFRHWKQPQSWQLGGGTARRNLSHLLESSCCLRVSSCEGLWVLPLAPCRGAAQVWSRLMAARRHRFICRLYCSCLFSGS